MQSKSRVPLVAGILNMIGGSCVVVSLVISSLFMVLAGMPWENPGVVLAEVVLHCVFAGMLLAGGAGLLMGRQWGRVVSLAWAGLALAIFLAMVSFVGPELVALISSAADGSLIKVAVVGTMNVLFHFVFPVSLLVALNLKRSRAALMSGRPGVAVA